MLKLVEEGAAREAADALLELDEIARIGARRMLMAALEAETADYIERHSQERDESGRARGAQRPSASAQAYFGSRNGGAAGAAS
jgi:hypothetical protein